MFQRGEHELGAWLHYVRDIWRAEQWKKVARDRPACIEKEFADLKLAIPSTIGERRSGSDEIQETTEKRIQTR